MIKRRLARTRHLAVGFAYDVSPLGPGRRRSAWASQFMTEPERRAFSRMPGRDRREGIRTARRYLRGRDTPGHQPGGGDVLVAAALLHDVGKRESGLGVLGRALATVSGALVGADMAGIWTERDGFVRRVGLYLRHAEIGEQMLTVIGARPTVAGWAGAHHDPQRWEALGLGAETARRLAAADRGPSVLPTLS